MPYPKNAKAKNGLLKALAVKFAGHVHDDIQSVLNISTIENNIQNLDNPH